MHSSSLKTPAIVAAFMMLFVSTKSHALRCGSKLVKDGMHEAMVIELCGQPVSVRPLGLVLRYYNPLAGKRGFSPVHRYHGYGVRQELLATEMLFNFGPHKLMRRIRFEGGRLVSIETAGYGYIQEDK